jgi:hypothetical protein
MEVPPDESELSPVHASESTQTSSAVNLPEEPPVQKKVLLTSVEVTDENVALNVIVSFLNLAQKRGAFTIDEAAKIWECIKKFQK